MAFKVCFLACLAWLSMETIQANHPVKLGVLVPDLIFLRRSYKSTAFRAVNSAQRDLDSPDFTLQVGLGFTNSEDSLGESYCSMVDDQGASAMLVAFRGYGRGEESNEEKVEQLATRLQVPTLMWNPDGYTPAHGPTAPVLYLMPTLRQQLAAMLDFMQSYGWKDYVIMSEYPAASFHDVNVSVVQFDEDTVQQGLSGVRQVLNSSPYRTKVVMLFADSVLAEQVFAEASADLLHSDHVWLLSAAAVDYPMAGDYPVGVFGFDFGEKDRNGPIKEVIQTGISAWYDGVKEAVNVAPEVLTDDVTANCEEEVTSASGPAFFKLMAANALDGFNHLGEPLGVELNVLNLKTQGEWAKMGLWTPQGGLDMNLPVFLGGQSKPPAAHA